MNKGTASAYDWITRSPPDLAVYHDFDEFIPEQEIPRALRNHDDDSEPDDR